MNEVFDIDKMPNRRLQVRQMVALHPYVTDEEGVHIVRRRLAQQLAQTIINDPTFFKSFSTTISGVDYIEYRADCVVLTQEEYLTMQRHSFRKGVEHAQGFVRREP